MKEECGIIGIYDSAQMSAPWHVTRGLSELQHRGEESCGIAYSDGPNLVCHKNMGLVLNVLNPELTRNLQSHMAIGHTRYSTQGGSQIENAQPFLVKLRLGQIAVAHNGTITNTATLRKTLEASGAVFQSSSDTEVVLHLIAQSRKASMIEAISEALRQLEGAFSLVFLTHDLLIAARDPHGFRPLAIGRTASGYVTASETCAFKHNQAKYVGEVTPGEIVVIGPTGLTHHPYTESHDTAHCVFEHVYFARPDSRVFGSSVYCSRNKMGQLLTKVLPVDGDIVVGVPDSGIAAADGYTSASGIRRVPGLVRSHYAGRSFIQPTPALRQMMVNLKLSAVEELVAGKRVILIDDSIVRGTTSQKIIQIVRNAGATEIHFRVSSPPLISPCFYGVDIPTEGELIANRMDVEGIRQYIGADSLAYLPIEYLLQAVGSTRNDYCTACLTGNYPTLIQIEG